MRALRRHRRGGAAAFDRGVGTVTHLFNAMRPLGHRDPGIAGAALARDGVIVQVILDGNHLAEETAQVVWRAAAGRVALVTDAIAAAGIGDGSYRLGGVEVEVRDGVARRADGVLAGSVADDDRGRAEPARARCLACRSGRGGDVGAGARRRPARARRARQGGEADLVVLDDQLEIRRVLRGGRERVAAGEGSGEGPRGACEWLRSFSSA